jgi:adenylate cyclase
MWVLTVRSPGGKPREYTIDSSKLSIGRRPENDIVIADLSASRWHAEIIKNSQDDTLEIKDLGSMNGTFVNRERLSHPRKLLNNDLIRIGEHVISVSKLQASEGFIPAPEGTHPITRDVLLESIDQHAVLIYEVSRKLNNVMDIQTALGEVSNMVKQTLGADKCEVFLADEFDHLGDLGFPTSIAQMVIDQKSAVIIPEVKIDDNRFGQSAYLYRVRSALCVPIVSGEELLGIIYMYKTNPEDRPFDKRDFLLSVAVSHQAALTIQRMQLLEQVRSEQRMRQQLQRFVSPSEVDIIAQSLKDADTLPDLAEQRLTVLFADISDSTGLAESLGAKRFGEILKQYYRGMTDIVFEHGGLIDKYLGDGIMAVFGITGNFPDPEERAVRAGLAMLDFIEKLSNRIDVEMNIGVGINTGNVVAGYVGTKERVELTFLGDVVNVAAGFQDKARPNRLVIGPATIAAVVGHFATRRVGSITVKGRMRDIQAYEILRGVH